MESELLDASKNNDLELVIKILKTYTGDIDVEDIKKNCTPLLNACSHNNVYMAKILLDRGADVNKSTPRHHTPFIRTHRHHSTNALEMYELLINYGAIVETQSLYNILLCGSVNTILYSTKVFNGFVKDRKNELYFKDILRLEYMYN